MATAHPSDPTRAPAPDHDRDSLVPVRRVLTTADLAAIHAAARAATDPAQLLQATLAVLNTALHTPTDRTNTQAPDDTIPGSTNARARTSPPGGYAIPTSQWDTVFTIVTDRAQAWGLAAELDLDLALNLLPATYDPDPQDIPAPPILADLRPSQHHLTLTRDAIEQVAACQTHLQRLRSRYHPAAPAYRHAADSWTDLLTVLLTAHPDAQVTSYGHLGLLIESAGGTTWALTYRPQARRCTTPGCGAVIDDDGTARAPAPDSGVLDHEHTPSYPLDGPAPGVWAAAS